MTATPEERAKAIVETIKGRQESWGWFTSLIAQAIRQAENDKLEEAARLCDGITESPRAGLRQTHASPYFARQIRNLKAEGAP